MSLSDGNPLQEKQTVHSAVNNEERIKMALEASNTGTWSWDMATNEAVWSDENYKLMGYEPGSAKACYENWISRVHPDDRAYANQKVEKAISEKGQLNFEYRAVWPDGTIHWINDIGKMILNPDGEPLGMYGTQIDITERKKAEEQLARIQAEWSHAMDFVDDAIYLLDLNDRILQVNQSFCEMFGLTPEEIIGKDISAIFHPQGEALSCPVCRARHEKRDATIIMEADHPDNNTGRPIQVMVRIIRNDQGEPLRVLNATRDLSTQENLRKQAQVLDQIRESVITTDLKGNITSWNRGAEKLFEYKANEVIGKHISMVYPDEEHRFLEEQIVQPLLKKGNHEVEARMQRKSSEIFHAFLILSLLKNDTGEPVGMIGSSFDITKRKRDEEQLAELKEHLQAIYDASPDMIFIHSKDGRIIDVNDNMLRNFGYSREEVRNVLPSELSGEGYTKEMALENIRMALEGENPDFEWMSRRKNGEEFPVEVRLRRLELMQESGEKETGVLAVARDISHRKELETQLVHAQKMEAVGQLAGGVAHDFNNLLTTIIGYGSLLQMTLENDPISGEYVEQILASSQRAATLTQNLLTFSRKEVSNPKPLDLNKVIHKAGELLSRLICEDVKIETKVTEKDLVIVANSVQIEQILMNLSTNACDAMPKGGHLSIQTDLLEMDDPFIQRHGFGKRGFYACITISDTGSGIESRTLQRIFEPFFTTKERGKGTGLGLSIVYGIIKQHNGYIDAESRPGEGTTFRIYLPAILSAAEEKKLEELPELMRGSETILVVEDDEQVRKVTRQVLENSGYKVIEALDGEDGVKKYQENKENVQLLLLDVIMPRKNGKEVYEEIQKMYPKIKALFTSGYTDDILNVKGGMEAGLHFIEKPALPSVLLRKIREVLDTP